MKIKKGDKILILTGKDNGKQATVSKVFSKENKIMAEGINIKKRHESPKRQGQKGRVVEIPAPFDISKVMVICPKCDKPTRIGNKVVKGGKARICKKCEAEI